MPIKTFTAGEVLTAADTNTYLANSGLVYIGETSATLQASIVLNNIFSATYDVYRLQIQCVGANNNVDLIMRLVTSGGTPATTNYISRMMGFDPSVNATTFALSRQSTTAFVLGGAGGGEKAVATCDIAFPFEAEMTGMNGQSTGVFRATVNNVGMYGGVHQLTNSYTGVQILASAGNITAKVRAYGYRIS
jgi:hypothetical protein